MKSQKLAPSPRFARHRPVLQGAVILTCALLLAAVAPLAQAQLVAEAAPVAAATNTITGVSFATTVPGQVSVTFDLKQPLTQNPAGFTVSNPSRVAIDLPDTINGLDKSNITSSEGDLRSINVVQAGTRTRLVFNLARPMGFETRNAGNKLTVVLTATATVENTPTLQRFAAIKSPMDEQHSVGKVDFRRGTNGEGRVLLDLSDPRVEVDIRRIGRRLTVDFLDATLAADLRRKLDVRDFATPVQFIETSVSGNNVHLVVESDGNWDHSAYQAEKQFVLEVRKTVDDPNKLVQGPNKTYNGDKLSLNFQNVEIRNVLQVIADFTGLNIIAADTVTGNITLRLKDVPWDQALDILLQTRNLSMKREGNVVLISPAEEIAAKEKSKLETALARSELEALHTEIIQLNYQRAEDILKLLMNEKQGMVSKRGAVTVDARTNTVFVRETDARLEEIRRVISRIDVAVRQVMIEARIVIAKDTFSHQLGVRLGLLGNQRVGRGTLNVGTYTGTQGVTGLTNTPNVNLPASTVNGTLGLTLLNSDSTSLLSLELTAAESDGKQKTISSPRVITSDKQKAMIEQGTEIPYQQSSSSGATNVSFKPATLSLAVTPRITPDGRVAMDLEVKKDTVGALFNGVPSIDTNKVTTQLLVDDGETAVLGGIYEIDTTDQIDKVPGLGDLPYLGNLFKRTSVSETKSELLIFITPRVLRDSLNVR